MSELEKMRAARDESYTLSRFIDWLDESGYAICEQRDFEDTSLTDVLTVVTGVELEPGSTTMWWPIHKSFEQLLADFFDIDLNKLEEERRELLENLRKEQQT